MTRTYCRICEAACGLVVDRDAEGRPIKLRPDRDHPTSRGYACAKGTRFLEVAHSPARLLEPKTYGEPTSWDHAIGVVATKLRAIIDRHGPHAVGVYFGNPMAFNALGFLATIAFAKALGTRNLFYAGSQDCNNKFAGADIVHGSPVIQALPDFQHCDLAIVLGSNPYVSQSSFIHLEGGGPAVFGGILDRGGHIVWIDPRRTESANKWGEHLPIRPGTDAWLLLALLKLCADRADRAGPIDGLAELLGVAARIDLDDVADRTGIARAQIEALADRIRNSRATALHMSVGVNQSGFGTLAYVLLQALAYVTGNYDRRGGLLVHPASAWVDRLYRWAGLGEPTASRIGGFASMMGTLPGGILADEIRTPGPDRIRALVVIAGDPLRSIPGSDALREAFSELELLTCIDMFQNATGEHAHVLLPSASWLERWDFALSTVTFQQTPLVQVAGPVLPPVGDTRTDAWIVGHLANAMGLRGRLFALARSSRLHRMLPTPRYGVRGLALVPGRWLRKHRLRVWDARVRAEIDRLLADPPPRDDAFTLICRRRRLGHNSWLHGGVRDGDSESTAWASPEDLARLGIDDGALVEIASAAGHIRIPLRSAQGVAPRTIVVPHGLPDLNVNRLIPGGADNIERVSGQLKMTGIAADVRPLPQPPRSCYERATRVDES